MIDRVFLDHPRTVGESYPKHARTALGFGVRMIAGGVACVVHALVPVWFERTGSSTVKILYARMKARQPAFAHEDPAFSTAQWQPEYEI